METENRENTEIVKPQSTIGRVVYVLVVCFVAGCVFGIAMEKGRGKFIEN